MSDHISVLDKAIVTKLNTRWHPFEQLTVRDAITMLCSESNGQKPGFAMDFITVDNEMGEPKLQYAIPTSWDDWIRLEVRPQDFAIQGVRGLVRVPLVVICAAYEDVPMINPKLGNDAILRRDGYTCQYTGEKLPRHLLNVDHVLPRDRGGRDTWENQVASRRDINFTKGNKTNREAGLKLIREPRAPVPMRKVIRPEDVPADIRQQVMPFLYH